MMSSRASSTSTKPGLGVERESSTPTLPNDEERAVPEKEKEKDKEVAVDPNLVRWEENDKQNPRNWSTGYKSWVTFL